MKRILDYTRLLSVLTLLLISAAASAQNTDGGGNQFEQKFNAMTNDASLGCALFLPSNINGITELMTLCGGRYAFKVAPSGMLESQLLLGSGKAQKYYLTSIHYRADIALEDMMASLYGGLDIHDAVSPVRDANGNPVDSSSCWYLGVHVGAALWWEVSDTFFLRTDLQVNYSPGTTLIIFLSGVYRWGSGGGGGN